MGVIFVTDYCSGGSRAQSPLWAWLAAASGLYLLLATFLVLGIHKRNRFFVGVYLGFGLVVALVLGEVAYAAVGAGAPAYACAAPGEAA
ncbi:hypothetical protein EVAR_41832_1 [Eumeta japonica]|uniref:Uncharacterized protein n=1 Tax=Eumeta variegata TaxID=151549 RepID=A0A4C1XB12_EUMVA|nr:hypothetical protein EVAR_41832_1 [Eumeta japonica]